MSAATHTDDTREISLLPEPVEALQARIDAAVMARGRRPRRSLADTMAVLCAAAARWRADAALAAALPSHARLSPAMVAAHLPEAADALDPAAMMELVERAWGHGAATRPAGAGPAVVAHVLASNVPALALPAIALGCLAGAVVVIKSGRRDPLSARAFQRALAAIGADLAATVVTTYWKGGDRRYETAVLDRADVVVATGGAVALSSLGARTRARLLAHGPRWSVGLVGRAGADDPGVVAAAARDVITWDQRGCLSPHVLYVEGDASGARAFAATLAAALEREGERLPPGPTTLAERAAARVARADAEWSGDEVLGGASGTVLFRGTTTPFAPTHGRRTVRVHALPAPAALPALLPEGGVECVGIAHVDARLLLAALRARGVARLCPLGRMQSPRLTWPRGQQAPLGALLADAPERAIEVEACPTI